MLTYELWIMVVGGDDDKERRIYKGIKAGLMAAIQDHAEEVDNDMDAYFELIAPDWNYTFSRSADLMDHITRH